MECLGVDQGKGLRYQNLRICAGLEVYPAGSDGSDAEALMHVRFKGPGITLGASAFDKRQTNIGEKYFGVHPCYSTRRNCNCQQGILLLKYNATLDRTFLFML